MINEILCERGESIVLPIRPERFYRDVLALDITDFLQTLAKCGYYVGVRLRRRAAQESNHRHRRLLRAHRERSCGRTADKRDELSPPHSITSSAGPQANTREPSLTVDAG